MSLETQKFYTSWYVIFDENIFSFFRADHQSLFPYVTIHSDYTSIPEDISASSPCSRSPLHSSSSMDENPRTPIVDL